MRLLVTALACLISVSMFGEVIRTDINHDGELYKTTLITDSINQQSFSIKVAVVGVQNADGAHQQFKKLSLLSR